MKQNMPAVQYLREDNCVEGETVPTTLGKFLNAEGSLACLKNETIRFTPPNQLNDEGDCIPSGYTKASIENDWRHSPLALVFPEQEQHFMDEHVNRDWSPLREQLSHTIGVASFTDLHNCDLAWMWNRYGDYHKGCMIVFDTTRMGTFFKVKYSEKRPEISIPIDRDEFPHEEVLAVLTTKEMGTINHWEKECEWRKIERLGTLDPTPINGEILYLRSYHKAFIKVVCGHSMGELMFKEIAKLAACKEIPVEKESAIMMNRGYGL